MIAPTTTKTGTASPGFVSGDVLTTVAGNPGISQELFYATSQAGTPHLGCDLSRPAETRRSYNRRLRIAPSVEHLDLNQSANPGAFLPAASMALPSREKPTQQSLTGHHSSQG